jgi:hypothetical protein
MTDHYSHKIGPVCARSDIHQLCWSFMVQECQSGAGEFWRTQETYKRDWLWPSIPWPNRQFYRVVQSIKAILRFSLATLRRTIHSGKAAYANCAIGQTQKKRRKREREYVDGPCLLLIEDPHVTKGMAIRISTFCGDCHDLSVFGNHHFCRVKQFT